MRRRDALVELSCARGVHNVTPVRATATPTARDDSRSTARPGAAARRRPLVAGPRDDGRPPPPGDRHRPRRRRRAATGPRVDPRRRPPAVLTASASSGVRVELVRSTFIRAEVYGEFDIETAAETALRRRRQAGAAQRPRNPIGRRSAPSSCGCGSPRTASLAGQRRVPRGRGRPRRAGPDGPGPLQPDRAQRARRAQCPRAAELRRAPSSRRPPARWSRSARVALGASSLIHTQKLILRGGEVVVSQGIIAADGSATVDARGTQVSVLLDIEVDVHLRPRRIVRVEPASSRSPPATRRSACGPRGTPRPTRPPGQLDYLPIPVFDPSKGYTPRHPGRRAQREPAARRAAAGARASGSAATTRPTSRSRSASALDLGIVTVDTVRVRARLDGPPFELHADQARRLARGAGGRCTAGARSSSRRSASRAAST